VSNVAKIVALSGLAVLVMASPAAAADGSAVSFSGAFGVGLTVIGAAFGIGKLASAALESMARQPEVAGNIQIAMIIAAALIEGFTFYALFICSTQNPFAGG
jgi:F-type H+-transporting ATPase subunit c